MLKRAVRRAIRNPGVTDQNKDGKLNGPTPVKMVCDGKRDSTSSGPRCSGTALVFPKKSRSSASSYFGPVFKVTASAATTVNPASLLSVTQPMDRAIFQRGEQPLFPRLRSGHRLFQRPSPGKQFPATTVA